MIELNAEARIKKNVLFIRIQSSVKFRKKKLKEREKTSKINIKTLIGENLPRHKCNIGCHGHYLGEHTQ